MLNWLFENPANLKYLLSSLCRTSLVLAYHKTFEIDLCCLSVVHSFVC